ncbi:MAG: hypothetical protein RJB08_1576 [Actinomycetota bacterium]
MPSNPLTDPDWAQRTVDFIDKWVGIVRDRTTKPLIAVVRGIVYGVLILTGVTLIAVLGLIALTRGLQAALDAGMSRDAAVWASYLILGGLLFVIGLLIARKQRSNDEL